MQKIIEREDGTRRVQMYCEGTSRTEKAHQKRVNINTIMKKATRTGMLPGRSVAGYCGDFTGAVDFHTAQNQIIEANNAFMSLPSHIRKEFKNDPGQLIEFLSDNNNRKKAIELGIIPPPEPVQPEPVSEPVPDPVVPA